MRKKFVWEWEQLDENTRRAKVIGGWIVHTILVGTKTASDSLVFIADRDHEWHIIKPQPALNEDKAP